MADYIALIGMIAPPGTALAVGSYVVKKVLEHDGLLKAQNERTERIESQVDRLVDHLIDRKQ